MLSGAGMAVNHSFPNWPSEAAAMRPSWCSSISGSRRMPRPSRMVGCTLIMFNRLAVNPHWEQYQLDVFGESTFYRTLYSQCRLPFQSSYGETPVGSQYATQLGLVKH